jgi:hypothetical protein
MKKVFTVVILCGLLVTSTFNSCKILDVTETFDLDITLIVDEANASFSEFVILDAVAESSDIEEYQDLLKEIEIEKVVVTLTAFNGSPTQTMTATLDVMDTDGNGVATLGTVSDVNMQDLTTNSMEIPLNQEGVDRLQELILDSPHAAKFQYYGTGNEAPLDFTAKFIMTVKMTANPLD